MPQSYHTEFLTATILQRQHLLKDDYCKETITDSFQWLVDKKRCSGYAFRIMPKHIHLLWKIADGFEREAVQRALIPQILNGSNIIKINDSNYVHRWRGRQQ